MTFMGCGRLACVAPLPGDGGEDLKSDIAVLIAVRLWTGDDLLGFKTLRLLILFFLVSKLVEDRRDSGQKPHSQHLLHSGRSGTVFAVPTRHHSMQAQSAAEDQCLYRIEKLVVLLER